MFNNFFNYQLSSLNVSLLILGVILLVISLSLFSYLNIYIWRSLDINLSSFLWFFLNCIICILYIYSLLTLYFISNIPIFLENLPKFIIAKYFILFSTCSLGILIYIYFRKNIMFRDILGAFQLKEETRKILYSWNDSFMGDLCCYILDRLVLKKRFVYFFLILHFSMFIVIPYIQTFLLINFTFFRGDLRLILYVIPFSFIIWLYSFIDYYFKIFFVQSSNYIRSLLVVNLLTTTKTETFNDIIIVAHDKLLFTITDFGKTQGFTQEDLNYLSTKWIQLSTISIIFEKYEKNLMLMRILNISLRLACWFFICYYFISSNDMIAFTFAVIINTFNRIPYRFFHSSLPLRANEARWIQPQHRGAFNRTFPGLRGDHPVIVDPALEDENNFVPLRAQATHNNGPQDNPSKEINSSRDLAGNNQAQRMVVPTEQTSVKKSWLGSTISGSTTYLEESECKQNLAKYVYNDPDFDNT